MYPYSAISGPFAETYQNNRWNTRGAYAGNNDGPRRGAPAELPYIVQKGGKWTQGAQRVRDVKPKMYFVRPVDGKRPGAYGRFLDGISGEGPDVFVSKCGDKRTLMRDRPQRWQWSGWQLLMPQQYDLRRYDKDFRDKDLRRVHDLPTTKGARLRRGKYDFKTRKYQNSDALRYLPPDRYWTDARWRDGAKHNETEPLCYRDGNREWYTKVPLDAGEYAGGRPRN